MHWIIHDTVELVQWLDSDFSLEDAYINFFTGRLPFFAQNSKAAATSLA